MNYIHSIRTVAMVTPTHSTTITMVSVASITVVTAVAWTGKPIQRVAAAVQGGRIGKGQGRIHGDGGQTHLAEVR